MKLADFAEAVADQPIQPWQRDVLTRLEDAPHCRWCRKLVIHGLPCTCDRAQRELASIRAGTER